MSPEKIAQKPWAYTLYRLADGQHVLSVLCGGAALYELNIPLDDETAAQAIADQSVLEACASKNRSNPEQYASQSVGMPID